MTWHDIYRRLSSAERAAEAIRPEPDTDHHIDWAAILSPADKERLRLIREDYLKLPPPRRKLVEVVGDDALDFLAVIAERVKTWQDGQEAPTETA